MKTIGALLFTTDLVALCAGKTPDERGFHEILKAATQNNVAMQDLTLIFQFFVVGLAEMDITPDSE
jgi:hypothetical protein